MKDNNAIDQIYKSAFADYKAEGSNGASWEAIQKKMKKKPMGASSLAKKFTRLNVFYATLFTVAASATAFTYKEEIAVFAAKALHTESIVPDISSPKNNRPENKNAFADSGSIDSMIVPSVAAELEIRDVTVELSKQFGKTVSSHNETLMLDANESEMFSEVADTATQKVSVAPPILDITASASTDIPEQQVERMYVKQGQVVLKDSVIKVITKKKRRNRSR